MSTVLTFIEPYSERLFSLLTPDDRAASSVIVRRVQEVPLSVFDQLGAKDLLFIDSSHVAKVGSGVNFIFIRIIPKLKWGSSCISTKSFTRFHIRSLGFAKGELGTSR
jgi:hypothetical protein